MGHHIAAAAAAAVAAAAAAVAATPAAAQLPEQLPATPMDQPSATHRQVSAGMRQPTLPFQVGLPRMHKHKTAAQLIPGSHAGATPCQQRSQGAPLLRSYQSRKTPPPQDCFGQVPLHQTSLMSPSSNPNSKLDFLLRQRLDRQAANCCLMIVLNVAGKGSAVGLDQHHDHTPASSTGLSPSLASSAIAVVCRCRAMLQFILGAWSIRCCATEQYKLVKSCCDLKLL